MQNWDLSISGNSLSALKGKFCQWRDTTLSRSSPSYWTNNQPSSLQASKCVYFFIWCKNWQMQNLFYYRKSGKKTTILGFPIPKFSTFWNFLIARISINRYACYKYRWQAAPAMVQCTSKLLWNWSPLSSDALQHIIGIRKTLITSFLEAWQLGNCFFFWVQIQDNSIMGEALEL